MVSKKSPVCGQILSVCFVIFLAAFAASAQIDPNPDSPTPVLISQKDSLRVLATSVDQTEGEILTPTDRQAFMPNSIIVIYITNVDLLADEDAGAFRLYVEDSKGRKYRFPVLDARPVRGQQGVYALTVMLRDEIGFWEQPKANGDLLVGVTWRGLASNRLRLGFGRTGGDIRDDAAAIPTPSSKSRVKESVESPGTDAVGYRHSGDRTRFMEQASFGPTPALDEKIRRFGLRVWLGEQLDAPYPTTPYPVIPLMGINPPADCNGLGPNNNPPDPVDIYPECRRDRYTQYPLQNWFFQEAFYGNAQLRHRAAWTLSQLWVISGVDTQQSSHMIAYHQLLSKNAFGNYRTLMNDMTLNPGMGNYLDMVRNTRNNPNENYAREILQLFSVGLFMLKDDGTLKLDSNNNPIPTYDQATVNNFTKVFTGWGFCETTGATCPNRTIGAPNYKDPMLLNHSRRNSSVAFSNSLTRSAMLSSARVPSRRLLSRDAFNCVEKASVLSSIRSSSCSTCCFE
jgi:hypothetical protein